MTTLHYLGMPSAQAQAYRSGAPDAYDCAPERAVSDGAGNPCRHCLRMIPRDAPMLILAYRPFGGLHPYAETGPVFLCAEPCAPHDPAEAPPVLRDSPDYLLKGYRADERIAYGTGRITPRDQIGAHAAQVLADPQIAFVDVRSARNNCWQARITRG